MPQIRYNMLSKAQVDRFIGKAKINGFVFYLIKWKPQLNRSISWQPTSRMSNMGKNLVKFNQKIKNKNLPFIEDQYKHQGMQLLKKVNELDQQQKRKWKIQKIIGKRYLNGGIYYFMKWKERSIFESDWIAQHGLWRLYPSQLKEFKARINVFNLPYHDKESFQEFIQLQRTAFLNQPHFKNISQLFHDSKSKKEKLMDKKMKKQQQKVKSQSFLKSNLQIITQHIFELRQRFFRPIETLYLKTQDNGVKIEENEYQSTNELLQQSFNFSETESNKLTTASKKVKNQTLINNKKNHLFDQKDSDEEKITSFKNQIDEIMYQTTNRLKKKKKQQNQKSQNNDQIRLHKNDLPKLEHLQLSKTKKSSNKLENKNYSFGFQKQVFSDEQFIDKTSYQISGTSKQVKFQFNGQLSKSFLVDNLSISKNYQLSITQENFNIHQHSQSRISQQNIQMKENIKPDHNKINNFQSQKVQNDHNNHHERLFDQIQCKKQKFSQQSQVAQKQKAEQKQKNIRKIVIKKKTDNFSSKQKKQIISEKTLQKEKIISIRLFAQNITSLQNSEHKQNLYEVVFEKPIQRTLNSEKVYGQNNYVEKQKTQEKQKERRFLETSYLKKYHNSQFLEYLEKEVVKLKTQK